MIKKYEHKIREFREREDSKRTPSKLCRALKNRPKFAPLKEQPPFIGGDEVCFSASVYSFICLYSLLFLTILCHFFSSLAFYVTTS